jgi:hypothetical protein
MVTHGPSGVPSRPGVRLGGEVEQFETKISAHNASAYQRRVAAKGACEGAQPVVRPRGPPVTGGVPAGVSRPQVNWVAPAGAGRPPVNGGAASEETFAIDGKFSNSLLRSIKNALSEKAITAFPRLFL